MKYALIARKARCDTPENHLLLSLLILFFEKNLQKGGYEDEKNKNP